MDIIKVIEEKLNYKVVNQLAVQAIYDIIKDKPTSVFCVTFYMMSINVYIMSDVDWLCYYREAKTNNSEFDPIIIDIIALTQIFDNIWVEFMQNHYLDKLVLPTTFNNLKLYYCLPHSDDFSKFWYNIKYLCNTRLYIKISCKDRQDEIKDFFANTSFDIYWIEPL